jgi:hypothetical protein
VSLENIKKGYIANNNMALRTSGFRITGIWYEIYVLEHPICSCTLSEVKKENELFKVQ